MTTARALRRQGFDVPQRLTLLEDDADEHDTAIDRLTDTMDKRLGKIMWAFVGLVITFSTSALLLALNLMVVK